MKTSFNVLAPSLVMRELSDLRTLKYLRRIVRTNVLTNETRGAAQLPLLLSGVHREAAANSSLSLSFSFISSFCYPIVLRRDPRDLSFSSAGIRNRLTYFITVPPPSPSSSSNVCCSSSRSQSKSVALRRNISPVNLFPVSRKHTSECVSAHARLLPRACMRRCIRIASAFVEIVRHTLEARKRTTTHHDKFD